MAYHQLHIADALERVVESSVGHLHQDLGDWLGVVARIHAIGSAKLARCAAGA